MPFSTACHSPLRACHCPMRACHSTTANIPVVHAAHIHAHKSPNNPTLVLPITRMPLIIIIYTHTQINTHPHTNAQNTHLPTHARTQRTHTHSTRRHNKNTLPFHSPSTQTLSPPPPKHTPSVVCRGGGEGGVGLGSGSGVLRGAPVQLRCEAPLPWGRRGGCLCVIGDWHSGLTRF